MTSTVEHEHCLAPGCGRRLHCAASRARGYGWGCWRKIRAVARLEALTEFTARQIEQACELIEDVAIIPASILGVFWTVSSDGSEFYRTSLESCDCPASRVCYHQAALVMVSAR